MWSLFKTDDSRPCRSQLRIAEMSKEANTACLKGSECATGYCGVTGRCEAPNVADDCRPPASSLQSSSSQDPCSSKDAVCDPKSGRCVPSSIGEELRTPKTGGTCEHSTQCPAGQFCTSDGKCAPRLTVGQSCTSEYEVAAMQGKQCADGLWCHKGFCRETCYMPDLEIQDGKCSGDSECVLAESPNAIKAVCIPKPVQPAEESDKEEEEEPSKPPRPDRKTKPKPVDANKPQLWYQKLLVRVGLPQLTGKQAALYGSAAFGLLLLLILIIVFIIIRCRRGKRARKEKDTLEDLEGPAMTMQPLSHAPMMPYGTIPQQGAPSAGNLPAYSSIAPQNIAAPLEDPKGRSEKGGQPAASSAPSSPKED